MSEIKNGRLGLYGKVLQIEQLGFKGLKPSILQTLSFHGHPLRRLISWNLTTPCLVVTGGVTESSQLKLDQLAFGRSVICSFTYLLTRTNARMPSALCVTLRAW